MSAFRTSLVAVASLVSALAGCSPEPAAPEVSAIRLVDELERASVRSDVDLADWPAVLQRLGGPTRVVASDQAVSVSGDWLAPLLFPDRTPASPTLVIHPTEVPKGMPVSVSLPAAPGVERAFVLDSDADAAALRNRKSLKTLLESARSKGTELSRQADGTWSGTLPSVQSGQALACLATPAGPAAAAAVEFRFPGREGQWLLTTPAFNASPWARRTAIALRSSESVVLAAPSEVSWPVHLPGRRPHFTTSVRTMFTKGATCSLAVRLDQQVLWTGAVQSEATQLDLDLSAYADRDVVLSLACSVEGQAALPLLVIETPVIEGDAPDQPMDVILVSLDTVRADRMSLYGGPRATTPAIDALAGSSMVFDNATAAAPWTLPSHVSIFSGQLPDRHRVYRETSRIPHDLPWLPTDFRQAGYETVAFTASGFVDPILGFATGFESYGTTELVYPQEFAARKPKLHGESTAEKAAAASAEHRRLMELLGSERRRPLFLFVHTYQPHEYRGEPDVLLRFGASENDLEALLDGPYGGSPKDNPFLAPSHTPEQQERLRERAELMYDASLVSADELVADIVAALTAAGRLDRTLLVITSDHGEELLNRSALGHGKSLYAEQIHVPLLIHGPGVPPGRTPDLVSLVDLAPTLRALSGLQVPPGRASAEDGQSLVPILSGERQRSRFLMARGGERRENDTAFRALRGERLKLIETETADGSVGQLFDLAVDPGETVDLAAARPADVEQARQLLRQWVNQLQAAGSDAVTSQLDADTEATLKGLGYLGGR